MTIANDEKTEELHSYLRAAEKLRQRVQAVMDSGAALHPSVQKVFHDTDVPEEWIDLFIMFNPLLFKGMIDALESAATAGRETQALTAAAGVILLAP